MARTRRRVSKRSVVLVGRAADAARASLTPADLPPAGALPQPTADELNADMEKMKRLPTLKGMPLVIRRVLAGMQYCVQTARPDGKGHWMLIPPALADELLACGQDVEAMCAALTRYKHLNYVAPRPGNPESRRRTTNGAKRA